MLFNRAFAHRGISKYQKKLQGARTIVRSKKLSTTFLQKPGEGNMKKASMIHGEGIGPYLCESVQEIFQAANVPVRFDTIPVLEYKDVEAARRNQMETSHYTKLTENDVILKGPISHDEDLMLDNHKISQTLDIYAYIVHAFSIPGVQTRHEDVDIVVIRENSEGEYASIEHELLPGVIESIKVITQQNSRRIAEYAFEYALLSNRKKVTVVHKANIMKLCDGEFLDAAREVSQNYPTILYEEMIVDATCMNLAVTPQTFDVMLLPNLYGSIIGSIVAGIVGGAGIAPGANIGRKYAIFEQGARHAGKDIATLGTANPTAFVLSSVMMLRHLGLPFFAEQIQNATFKTLEAGHVRTPDIGGHNSTKDFVKAIISNLDS
jgi:isocitrate dehydrogenase (NAD+)